MRILFFSFLLLFYSESFSQSYPHFFELRGLEDGQGNTHLFYRYGYSTPASVINCWSRSIYHFNLNAGSDTLFIYDAASDPIGEGCRGQGVGDYEFFTSDPAKYIYGGYDFLYDPVPILIRYDGILELPVDTFGGITAIEISNQNENLIYAAIGSILIKSIDGGYNFIHLDSIQMAENSIISLSRNNNSQIYGTDNNKLVRSENEGQSYILVDDNPIWNWDKEKELYYDVDGQHIYGVSSSMNESALLISDNNGDPFTWNLNVTSPAIMSFTMDEQNTGEIYYSYKKKIFKSTDYGASFLLYKELDQKITGLYKKSGSDILYACTPLKIYEITTDSIHVVKSIPIPEEAYAWLPLNLEDKWVYKYAVYGVDSLRWFSILQVVDYKIIENQVYNKVLVTEIPIDSLNPSGVYYQYFRVDSSSGLVYQAWLKNDSLWFEELYMDLIAEVGDTIPVRQGLYLGSEVPFSVFGLNSRKRTYDHNSMPELHIELVNGLGLVFQYELGYVGYQNVLKGCVIDGVVYGDTTVVSVDDEIPSQPIEFSLSQNYPNPFNPSTNIQYTVGSQQFVTLKIYDVLGNEVATLVNEESAAGGAGEYEVEFNAINLPSGIYFYQLKAGSFIQTRKMLLIK